MIIGSLVMMTRGQQRVNTPPWYPGESPSPLPSLVTLESGSRPRLATGRHLDGPTDRGLWHTRLDLGHTGEAHVPIRGKHILVETCGPDSKISLADSVADAVSRLDPSMPGSTYGQKLNVMIEQFRERDFAAVVRTEGKHSTFILLAGRVPINVIAYEDDVTGSHHLLWTTYTDLELEMRALDPVRYMFYRMPRITQSALFIPSQVVCSRWSSWIQRIDNSSSKLMRCFSVLERLLYRGAA